VLDVGWFVVDVGWFVVDVCGVEGRKKMKHEPATQHLPK